MRKILILSILAPFFFSQTSKAQYDIELNVNKLKDTTCYLVKYTFNYHLWVDTAKVSSKGNIHFKGTKKLDEGLYMLVGQSRNRYFDFIVNNKEPKFSIKTDTNNFVTNATVAHSEENKLLFDYLKFILNKKDEFDNYKKTLTEKDSTEKYRKKSILIEEQVKAYQQNIIKSNAESFIKILLNLQLEPEIPEAPMLQNGRRDSTFAYKYYKAHFWDDTKLNDDRNLRTPFFYEKLKKYLNTIIIQHPDSINSEIDQLLATTKGNKEMFKHILFYGTSNFESSKIMGMDAVFVHLVDKYYRTNQAFWIDSTQLGKMTDRADILKPLLLNNIAPELLMIDTTNLATIEKLGFVGLTNSEDLTKKYYENVETVTRLSKSLHQVKAKYTILVFWSATCGHCQKEVPIIKTVYDKLKAEKVDIEVFAVLTQEEYKEWKDFIIKHNLNWINVADPVHLNNIHKIYDIYSTPVIYVLNANKQIIAKRIGADQIEDIIRHENRKQ